MHLSPKRFVFLSKHLSGHYRDKLKPGPPSWGEMYENLNSYVQLYDEKMEKSSIEDYINNRLTKDMKLIKDNDTDFSHRKIIKEIEKRLNW